MSNKLNGVTGAHVLVNVELKRDKLFCLPPVIAILCRRDKENREENACVNVSHGCFFFFFFFFFFNMEMLRKDQSRNKFSRSTRQGLNDIK